MIIKGGSRAGPSQLAWHLQRRDTNEKIEILELQSPAGSLKDAFIDWQTLSEGTQGFKGLYHANIDPAKDYVMTPAQWQRAVEVLEEELGFQGQPRAVVMHEKRGRQHIHVVWARTDVDKMTLRSDSQNYLAHERASKKLELEFGHEQVPGKHAKRDREKQPEFPQSEYTQAEWQQWERTGLDPAARKDQVTALKQACDNGQTFKAALEEAGYVLAKGDRRDFVIVDEVGNIHSLGRQIRGTKAADLRAFMKDVDREALPAASEAVDLQRQRQKEHLRNDQVGPEKAEEEKPDKRRRQKGEPKTEEHPSLTKPEDADKWLAYYGMKLEHQAARIGRLEVQLGAILEREKNKELEAYVAGQRDEMDSLKKRLREETSGIKGYIKARESRLNPTLGAEKAAQRSREIALMKRRMQREQKDYIALIDQTRQIALEELRHRPVELLAETVEKIKREAGEDMDRYLREAERYRQIEKEFEDTRRAAQEKREQPRDQDASQKADEPKREEPAKEPEAPAQTQLPEQPQQPAPDGPEARAEALKTAVAKRQAEERERLVEKQTAELGQLRETLASDARERLDRFDATFRPETEALRRRQQEASTGFAGFVESVRDFLSPGRGEARAAEQQREREELQRRQKADRDEYLALLQRTHEEEIRNLREHHARQLQEQAARASQELERYLGEHEAAEELRAEYEQQEKERAEEEAHKLEDGEEQIRDGPERPPPKLTQ